MKLLVKISLCILLLVYGCCVVVNRIVVVVFAFLYGKVVHKFHAWVFLACFHQKLLIFLSSISMNSVHLSFGGLLATFCITLNISVKNVIFLFCVIGRSENSIGFDRGSWILCYIWISCILVIFIQTNIFILNLKYNVL